MKGADLGGDGRWLVIDLNFAYNPTCAYDPAWACPLAPPGNVLSARVRAGELYRVRDWERHEDAHWGGRQAVVPFNDAKIADADVRYAVVVDDNAGR